MVHREECGWGHGSDESPHGLTALGPSITPANKVPKRPETNAECRGTRVKLVWCLTRRPLAERATQWMQEHTGDAVDEPAFEDVSRTDLDDSVWDAFSAD